MIGILVAVSPDGIIGKDKDIPWNYPEDLKRFKKLTLGKTVIMGRNTWESLPKKVRPLKGRRNIVITTTKKELEGAECFSSIEKAMNAIKCDKCKDKYDKYHTDIWFIGGKLIYSKAIQKWAKTIDMTLVPDNVDGDVSFPNIRKSKGGFVITEKVCPDCQSRVKEEKNSHVCKCGKKWSENQLQERDDVRWKRGKVTELKNGLKNVKYHKLTFSQSALSSFEYCPNKYKENYSINYKDNDISYTNKDNKNNEIEPRINRSDWVYDADKKMHVENNFNRKKGGESWATYLGTAVHDSLEWFYNERKKGKKPTKENLIDKCDSIWDDGRFLRIKALKKECRNTKIKKLIGDPEKEKKPEEHYRLLAHINLENYYEKNHPFEGSVKSIEKWFEKELKSRNIIGGFIDRLDEKNENYIINDYKTSKKLPIYNPKVPFQDFLGLSKWLQKKLNQRKQKWDGFWIDFDDWLIYKYKLKEDELQKIEPPDSLSNYRKGRMTPINLLIFILKLVRFSVRKTLLFLFGFAIEIPILSRKSRFVKKEDAGRQLRMYAILVKGEFGEEKQIEGILEHTLLDEIVYSDYDSILTEKSITNTENSIERLIAIIDEAIEQDTFPCMCRNCDLKLHP